MRLLYLSADPGVPVLGRKGASIHVQELVRALDAAGASIALASPRIAPEGEELPDSVELVGIKPVLPKEHATTAALDAAIERQSAQIVDAARACGADAVCERYSLFSTGGVDAARSLGVPHVLELNAPLREEAARFRGLPHAARAAEVEARVLAATGHVYVVSPELELLLRDQGVPASRLTVLPNGVDGSRSAPPGRRPGRDFTIGFAGSLKAWHGIGVLLEAFSLALEEEPRLRLEIAGTGPEEGLLDHADLPSGRLVRHGSLPHRRVLELMAGWDAGAAPFLPLPRFYFSPLKLVEYMAAGACPVASALGRIPELLGGGARGVLVPAGDAAALARALVALARDRESAWRLGSCARAWVLRSRTWTANAERILDRLAVPSLEPAG
jgi:glycosyltransferase involved in cell wall biosynthesis